MVTRSKQFATTRAHHLVGLLAMTLFMVLVAPTSVGAHASLLSTSPANGERLEASPSEIVLEFSEPVELVDGGTVLHGSDIEPITLSPEGQGATVVVPLDESLDDGAYILQWRVISADSHPVAGTVNFTVGDADASAVATVEIDAPGWIEWARTIAVAIKYVGFLAALGVMLVGWRLVPGDLPVAIALSATFAALGLLGFVLELPFAAMVQRGTSISDVSELWSAITDLDSGTQLSAVVAIVAAVLVIAWIRLYRSWLIPTGLMLIAVLSLILSGHTRSQEPIWMMMISDAAHVITAAVWLGGILLLTIGLTGRWKGEGLTTTESRFTAVSRFSVLAGYTAVIVIVSGALMALIILDSWNALFNTTYGINLLIKIGLVVVVTLLAAANRFWLIPKKERDADFSMSWLRKLVTIELVVLIAIAGVTGSLVHRDPNVQADSSTARVQSETVYEGEQALDSSHAVRLRVKATSDNRVTIVATIIDENRNIVLVDSNLELTWNLPEQNLGPLNQELIIDPATGAYTGEYSLPASGEWELGIRASIDRFTDSRTTVEILLED